MVVKTSQVSYKSVKSLSSWVQGELLRRAINSSPSKWKPWYTKRGSLAMVYKSTELHLVQDDSEDFQETRD